MMIHRLALLLLFTTLILPTPKVNALTVKEFTNVCHSFAGKCSGHPMLNAYIGGALDLIATLDEQTDYLKKVYCREPKDLFNVPIIIDYMQESRADYANENAMLVLVKYFEKHGGCK